ncbi:hypothetical protein EON81_21420 [bacterium]|nr:MAG: hypothetical protein EON81_21420 [bacterium]
MRLRLVFYGSILLGIGLMLGWPWIVGSVPQVEPKSPVLKAYSYRTLAYLASLLLTFLVCFVSAVFLVKRTRLEAAAEARANLQELTEGAAEALRRAREANKEPE